MFNRMIGATQQFARKSTGKSAAILLMVRDTASGFLTTAHHTFMILGLAAIATLAMMFANPDIADKVMAMSPFSDAVADDMGDELVPVAMLDALPAPGVGPAAEAATPAKSQEQIKVAATDLQQQRVTEWLSKRYRVAGDATNMLVSAAYLTSKEIKLDPLLILAVVAIESRFNPFAESAVGAQGLMQVMSKVHREKFEEMGGTRAALNPVANIKVGSLILKEYVTSSGSIEAGLKRYVGAGNMDTDFGYAAKVLGEYDRLKAVATGKRISASAKMASRVPPAAPPMEPDLQKVETKEKDDQLNAMREVARLASL